MVGTTTSLGRHPYRRACARSATAACPSCAVPGTRGGGGPHVGHRQHPRLGRGDSRGAGDALPDDRRRPLPHGQRQPTRDGGGQGRDPRGAHRLRARGARTTLREHPEEGSRHMNLDHGVLHHLCSCVVSGLHQLEWYEASALVNKWSAPLGWLNDRLLQFVELPFLGGLVESMYVALGVIEVFLGAALNTWLSAVATALLRPAVAAAAELLFRTPDFAALPALRETWQVVRGVSDALFLLAFVGAGALVMTQAGSDARYAAKVIVPRIVLAAVLANASLAICGALVALNNALV